MVEQLSVLVVDDDRTTLQSIRQMITRSIAGACVTEALSGEEALAAMRAKHFDAVLADYRMGFLDGITLLELARRDHPATCRILFTGHADFDIAREAINRAAVHGFLQKPLQASTLEKTIVTGLERARQEAETYGAP